MNQPIRYGIVGVGGFGAKRRERLRKCGAYEIIGGVDIREEAFVKAEAEEGRPLKRYASVEALVADPAIEAVFIATPANLHVPQAMIAARAGKAVFCEKPLGPRRDECLELVTYCEQNNIPHGHGFSARFFHLWQEVKRIVEAGTLGQIVSVSATTMHTGGLAFAGDNWRFKASDNPGGPLFQCGIHKIDTLRFLFGEGRWLSGVVNRTITASPTDDAYVLLGVFGGIPTTLHSHYVASYRHAMEIYGTKGDLFITEFPEKLEHKITDLTSGFESVHDITAKVPPSDAEADSLRDFAQAVRKRRQPAMSGREGLKSLDLVFQAAEIANEIGAGRLSSFECSAELKARYRTRGIASDPKSWQPPVCALSVPKQGVTLGERGLFRGFMERNISYLLSSFSVNEMLYAFRLRAGQKNPPSERDIFAEFGFWTEGLRGSETGRFLMGAANTLQWVDHPELRRRLEALVDGIAECQAEDGYVFAFDRNKPKYCENGNYARNWFTQGMVDAGMIYPKALAVMRRGQDWFNQCNWLPDLIYLSLGLQGHPANLAMYFSPVGKPEDVQVAEQYYVQDWWLDQLLARDPEAIWKYPLNRPHCYETAGFEAYLDHYLASGERKYLDAMIAAWDLMRANWEHIGGAWALCEGKGYPPQSYRLDRTGELCGSVFWIKFCQRFHRLFPEDEKYVGEIEKSIYNVVLANQGEDGIRYHALLDGHKETPNAKNTCCELHGTRIYAALPEYIYSLMADGVTVNLFESSVLSADLPGGPVRVSMETAFPLDTAVTLAVSSATQSEWNLRSRVPGWAAEAMPVLVNGETLAVGKPGSYVSLKRRWRDGDTVTFRLPATFRMTRYEGEDQPQWRERWALEYGPILMAFVGPIDVVGEGRLSVEYHFKPETLIGRLKPIEGHPLHYRIDGVVGHKVMPYWQVGFESFSAVPVFKYS